MNATEFLQGYTKVLCDDFGDTPYEVMRVKYGGMASPRTAKLLNFAVRCMSDDESYLEIGTHTGYTLISAGYETMARLIGIDDFRLARTVGGKVVEPLSVLHDNLQCTEGTNVSIFVNDFRNISLQSELDAGRRIGVFFIDADHTYQDVWDSFKWIEPYLAKEAIIILDDVRIAGVTEAMRKWTQDNPRFEEVFYCKTFIEKYLGRIGDPIFHNGIAIVRYQGA